MLEKINQFLLTKRTIAIFIGILLIIFVIIPYSTMLSYSDTLKTKEAVMNKNNKGITLYDRNGKPFYSFYGGKVSEYTPLSEIPVTTQQAVIAAEDKDFYQHNGFSPSAILRSVYLNLKNGSLSFGGSTITQQLVKNDLLNSKKNFLRKYQEIILAGEIEKRFSKDDILEMYLNSVYFGEGATGINEASKVYFKKEPKDLNLAESAMLAGILQAPSSYSPISGDKKAAEDRQKYVLAEMERLKFITPTEKQAAEKEVLTINKSGTSSITFLASHFALMVKDELVKKYGENRIKNSDFKVYTTLDSNWQSYAEKQVQIQVQSLQSANVTNGAAVVLDPKTAEIRALVGSSDWSNDNFGKVNMAISPRQPGSSFKPLVYLTAFSENKITPATILKDQPTTFEGNYKPEDFDHKYRGDVTARRALANSLNIPTVEVMEKIGVNDTLKTAKQFGITTLKDASNYGPALSLGTGEVKLLELTDAYATLDNQGIYNNPISIAKIEDKTGNVVFENKSESQKVADPKAAFLVTSILSDNDARKEEFGDLLTISRPAAVKTGTTENNKDAWTIGYTPSLVVGVWVGNNNDASMNAVAGATGAAPIWKSLMEKFSEGTVAQNFTPPDDVILADCAGHKEYFIQGTQNTPDCAVSLATINVNPQDLENQINSMLQHMFDNTPLQGNDIKNQSPVIIPPGHRGKGKKD